MDVTKAPTWPFLEAAHCTDSVKRDPAGCGRAASAKTAEGQPGAEAATVPELPANGARG